MTRLNNAGHSKARFKFMPFSLFGINSPVEGWRSTCACHLGDRPSVRFIVRMFCACIHANIKKNLER